MPWITLTEPKYPLTESEKKWLKQKEILDEVSEVCYTVGSCEDCYAKESCYLWPNDYRDAAEFEARVALTCVRLTYGELPCGADDCADKHMYSVCGDCDGCITRAARLAVEQEMEKEGK